MTGKRPFETVVAVHGQLCSVSAGRVLMPVDADDAWSETFLSTMKVYPELPVDANIEGVRLQ